MHAMFRINIVHTHNSANLSKTFDASGFVDYEICNLASLSATSVCLPHPVSYQCTCVHMYVSRFEKRAFFIFDL
jgi:hypothetical protein